MLSGILAPASVSTANATRKRASRGNDISPGNFLCQDVEDATTGRLRLRQRHWPVEAVMYETLCRLSAPTDDCQYYSVAAVRRVSRVWSAERAARPNVVDSFRVGVFSFPASGEPRVQAGMEWRAFKLVCAHKNAQIRDTRKRNRRESRCTSELDWTGRHLIFDSPL
jgi:hypothetical protein